MTALRQDCAIAPNGPSIRPLRGLLKDKPRLTGQTQSLDERTVTLDVDVLQVAEESAALTDEQEGPTTRVVVVLVLLEVLGEVFDAPRQHGHLNLGGTGVTGV